MPENAQEPVAFNVSGYLTLAREIAPNVSGSQQSQIPEALSVPDSARAAEHHTELGTCSSSGKKSAAGRAGARAGR